MSTIEEVNKLFVAATALLKKEGMNVEAKQSMSAGDKFSYRHPQSFIMILKDAQSPMVILYTNTKSKNDSSAIVVSPLSQSKIEPTSAEQIASWTKKLLDEHSLESSKAKKNIKVREEAKLNRVKLAEMLEEFGASQASTFDVSIAQKIFELCKWFIENDQDFSINYTREDD